MFLKKFNKNVFQQLITGMAIPKGSDKLYTGSTDGTVRTWDCQTGKCVNVANLGSEVTSLISEGPWIFVGLLNTVMVSPHILTQVTVLFHCVILSII
jgi:WD40 repeat protein